MKYLAHIAEDSREQTVLEHLEGTADLCGKFARAFGAEEQGRWIARAHDIGKCSEEFQNRLCGGRIVDHATAGAWECTRTDPSATWAAACIAGHHGGLPDIGSPTVSTSDDSTLSGRLLRALEGKLPEYHMPINIKPVSPLRGYGEDGITTSFLTRMMYSCLVDADFLDTEHFMSGGQISRDAGETLATLLDRLNGKKITPWLIADNTGNSLNEKRCKILQKCIEGSALPKGLYTLTVPTGGGKTISSMAFALNHAVKHGMDRIIYVIPYTSIIEQNAAVFRDIFGAQNVIEHHSNVSFEVSENGDTTQYRNIFATENWDAPIIVTTSVQFFESLYSNRSSKCRKLHSIANSVIIFDEAQMLPTSQLRPCVAAIAQMVKNFGATAVLCTATQPVLNDLFDEYAPCIEITELCPNITELYEAFRRVSFKDAGALDSQLLAERLSEEAQVLCIVNSRKSAQIIYEMLPEEGRFHLSTLMYPEHRRKALEVIKKRLKAGLACRVVSTSLIEAGVDVDFPSVWRERAGLDSILQAAGRCNREGNNSAENSVVTIFEGVSNTPQMLKINIGATNEVLRDGVDPASPETVEKYFRAYRSLSGHKLDQADIIELMKKQYTPFRTIAERFRMIDSNTKTVYIPHGRGADLIKRLQNGERSRALFRKLGQYSVNVYEPHYKEFLSSGAVSAFDDECGILEDIERYSEQTGLRLESEYGVGIFW